MGCGCTAVCIQIDGPRRVRPTELGKDSQDDQARHVLLLSSSET